jgi:methanogenic corrinoid protein MtbC1
MSGDEMNRKILELTTTKSESSIYIDQLVIAMVELDEEKFEKILAGLTLRFGFERTVVDVIYPFLEKIGVLWQTHHISPAQEHFISNLIRQKVIVAIDSLPIPAKTAKKIMLFLPEHELHEISLLFSSYRFRKAGFRTCYLGQAVPFEDLKSTFEVHHPQILLTCITSAISKTVLETYISKLSSQFPLSTILLTGYQVRNFQSPHQNVHVLTQMEQLDDHLA